MRGVVNKSRVRGCRDAWRLRALFIAPLTVTVWMSLARCYGASSESGMSRETTSKAAFLQKLMLFVEWPEPQLRGRHKATLAIIGKDPFGDAFGTRSRSTSRSAVLQIWRYRSVEDMLGDTRGPCCLAFLAFEEGERLERALSLLRRNGRGVLTVGDCKGFVEAGGMIGLVTVNNKVRWEINRTAVRRSGVTVNAQLLRSAVRVIAPDE